MSTEHPGLADAAGAVSRPYGVAELMEDTVAAARAQAERDERAAVAAEIAVLVGESGLTRAEFAAASRVGR